MSAGETAGAATSCVVTVTVREAMSAIVGSAPDFAAQPLAAERSEELDLADIAESRR